MVAALACLVLLSSPQREVFVAPSGSDSNAGSAAAPLASLEAAVERARTTKSNTIVVQAGVYRLTRTIALDARDKGLTIRAAKGSRPIVTGSLAVPPSAVSPCRDQAVLGRIVDPDARALIRQVDLRAIGLKELAPIMARGFPQPPRAAPNELFVDEKPMTLARWPNEGYAKIASVIEAGNGENDRDKPARQPIFTIADDRPLRWAQARDVWMVGYWKYDWADDSIPVQGIDPKTGVITLERPHTYGVDKGKPFFAENLLEELDRPGEYYFDHAAQKLYLIPPASGAAMEVSTLGEPLLTITGSDNVTVRELDFRVSRGDGIHIENSAGVRIEGCRLYGLGGVGAIVDGGHDSGLKSCDIWDTGEGGVRLSGGDRKTLAPAKNFVDNCDIHDYQRRSMTYRPAVLIAGVGNRVSHCAMHDAPHSAIIFSGNDHVIEYNELYRTVSRTGDGGVVYTGRDWTARGTEIRFNHFHDNIGLRQWEPAIYIDDLGSGIRSYGNLIERCHWGFMVGGGRDNVVENNVLIDCALAFDCDARGLGWAANSLPTMMERLRAVPYQAEPWRSKYPPLVAILDNQPMAPAGNVLRHNLLVRSGTVEQRMEAPFKKTVTIDHNLESPDASAWRQIPGFKALPVSKMGLQPDALRASLGAGG